MDAPRHTAVAAPQESALLTVHDVARVLNCSARTVYRLADSGRMPRPVKLNALVRWRREIIEQWVGGGCPRVKNKEVHHVGA
jgi:excisionase family DNA binding protein